MNPYKRRLTMIVLAIGVIVPAVVPATPITLQVKSFIATVDPTDPKQFDSDARWCQQGMALLVSCGTSFGENPSKGTKADGNYRLWSETKADVVCSGNKIARWDIKPISYDAGKELLFIPTSGEINPALIAAPALNGTALIDRVTLRYRMRGQPNVTAIGIMNQTKPRTCTWIWHTVEAELSCKDGKSQVKASMHGSGFPSHRLWIDGALAGDTPQGPFSNLWKCDPADATLVK